MTRQGQVPSQAIDLSCSKSLALWRLCWRGLQGEHTQPPCSGSHTCTIKSQFDQVHYKSLPLTGQKNGNTFWGNQSKVSLPEVDGTAVDRRYSWHRQTAGLRVVQWGMELDNLQQADVMSQDISRLASTVRMRGQVWVQSRGQARACLGRQEHQLRRVQMPVFCR